MGVCLWRRGVQCGRVEGPSTPPAPHRNDDDDERDALLVLGVPLKKRLGGGVRWEKGGWVGDQGTPPLPEGGAWC